MTRGSGGGSENGKFAAVRALIFDLDGTLIDSKLDFALAVDATLKHMGRPSLPHETIAGYVGRGASALIRSVLGEDAAGGGSRNRVGVFPFVLSRAHVG